MAKVVTKIATFECYHGGLGTVSGSSSKFTINVTNIINKTECIAMVILGCAWTGGGNVPCTALTSPGSITGESTKLTKDAIGVILDTSTLKTNTNDLSLPGVSNVMTITESQTKLTAV